MSKPTPTTLRETIGEAIYDALWLREDAKRRPTKVEVERIELEATQSILEQLKALLPEKPGVNKDSTDPLECRLYGFALAIEDIQKAIEEWAK